jgi:hypothetical protein
VGDVLVDDPEAVFASGQNERLAELAQRLEGAEVVQVLRRLLGFHLSSRRCRTDGIGC